MVHDLGKGKTFVTRFTCPNGLSSLAKKVSYMLIYRGKLGNEEGAVIGRYKALEYYGGSHGGLPQAHETAFLYVA